MQNRLSARRRRHLTAAVAVALAAACAGTLTSGVALATTGTTAAVSSGTAQESVAALLPNSSVIGNGPTGFLSVRWAAPSGGQSEYRWTRYKDGVTTLLPAGTYEGSAGSDVIVKRVNGATHHLYDMATGAAPVVIDTTSVGATARLVRAEGSTLVMEVPRAGGGSDVHLVAKAADGTLLNRKVSGVPATTSVRYYHPVAPGELLVRYWDATRASFARSSSGVATAKVAENRALAAARRRARSVRARRRAPSAPRNPAPAPGRAGRRCWRARRRPARPPRRRSRSRPSRGAAVRRVAAPAARPGAWPRAGA
ncbi:hypothetical protein SNARM312S_05025 [Streptomyces narbonensis]